jgi:hypothetical protein
MLILKKLLLSISEILKCLKKEDGTKEYFIKIINSLFVIEK